MKNIILVLIAFTINTQISFAQTNDNANSDNFVGQWKIDLRPTPSSEGYYQYFVVTKIDGNSFEGTFYGSPIKNGLINSNWDRFYFAFSTSDNTYDYFHSGYVLDGKIYGISYCPGREFTAPWNGTLSK